MMKKKLDHFLKSFDLYGHQLHLYVNDQLTVRSKVGALISLGVLGVCLFLFLLNIISYAKMQDYQTVSSALVLSSPALVTKNESIVYNFDYTNFYVYWVLSAYSPDGSIIDYDNLTRYVTQSIIYADKHYAVHNLEFEKCPQIKRLTYLLEDTSMLANKSEVSPRAICIKNSSIPMGLFANPSLKSVFTPKIIYQVSKCRNSTKNNNSCASEEEIRQKLPLIYVQATLPTTTYDFNNIEKPRAHSYDYKNYGLDNDLTKFYTNFIKPQYLYTDTGILNQDYHLDSIDFSVKSQQLDMHLRKTGEDILFNYALDFDFEQNLYYRKNQKIYILLGSLGGLFNTLFFAGKLLSFLYNRIVLLHLLINTSFSNLTNDKPQRFF